MVSQLAHSQAKTFRQAGELSSDYELKSYSAPSQHLAQWPYRYGPVLSGSVWLWWHQWNNESKHNAIIFHDFTMILPRFYQDFTNFTRLEWKIQELNQGKIVADQKIFMASTISKKLNYLDIWKLFRFWCTRKFSNVTYVHPSVHQKNKEENVHIKLPKFRQMDGIRKADFLIISHKWVRSMNMNQKFRRRPNAMWRPSLYKCKQAYF